MLTVLPKECEKENSVVLECRKDGEEAGCVKFRQNGFVLEVLALSPILSEPDPIDAETFAILDSIVRALGSYGLNHQCFYVESENELLYPTLAKLRFSLVDGKMKSNLQKLLQPCKP